MTNTIQTGTTLTATSIGDSNCIWTATVIGRKGNFITAIINGEVVRKKVNVYNGEEFVYLLGKYSMAPTFRAK
jgi:prolipoprotein diacylglyceryltransferase